MELELLESCTLSLQFPCISAENSLCKNGTSFFPLIFVGGSETLIKTFGIDLFGRLSAKLEVSAFFQSLPESDVLFVVALSFRAAPS